MFGMIGDGIGYSNLIPRMDNTGFTHPAGMAALSEDELRQRDLKLVAGMVNSPVNWYDARQ